MKHLMTHKFIFGLLMACVLALGVQGVADALTFSTNRSGDLQTVREDREFKIRFTPQPRSASRLPGFESVPSTDTEGDSVPAADRTNMYYDNSDGTGYTINTDTAVPYNAAHYYDQESISIEVTPGTTNAAIRKVGRFDATGTTLTMYERTHDSYTGAADNQKLSSGVELTLFADTPGTVGVTITATSDGPTGFVEPVSNFTVYIVAASLSVTANTMEFAGLINGSTSADDSDDPKIDDNFTVSGGAVASNIPMTYRVNGPGRVYVRIDERTTSATSTLETSSAAPVYLDMNGGTNRVTVSTPSVALEYPAIYIYGRPTLTITNGDDQEGVASGQLDEYLAVQVKDARGRTVPDLPVAFTTTGGGMFTPVSGMLYGTGREEADANTGLQATGLVIYTDRSGEAKTYYQLGTTVGAQNVTAALQSRFPPSQTFEATIGTGTRRPSIAIFSGNNQRTDENGDIEDPLVVIVRMGGNLKPSEDVEFRTVKGTLSGYTEASVAPGETLVPHTGKRVYARTNGSGQAEVEYFQEPGSGSDTVTATISDDNYEREVTFAINGASVRTPTPTPTPTPAPTPTNPTLTLSPTSLTGTASSNVPLAATVRNAAGNTVQGIGVSFTLSTTNSGAILTPVVITNANGVAQTNIILPNTNATVTATATVGRTPLTQEATITVSETTTGTGTGTGTDTDTRAPEAGEASELVIDGEDELTGRINSRLDDDLIVQVLDINGDSVSNALVSFRVTRGTGSPSTANRRTNRNGYASIGFTPRSDGPIEVEASVSGVDSVYFTITTGEPPDAIVLVSGNNQSGRPGATLANPLVVEVIDENDDPVSGITVTFAVTAGGGSVSPASRTTDNNGRAQTRLTLGDDIGNNTVTARVAGLTDRVTFRATSGAEVLVDAARRPDMYWISRTEGKLQRLVADDVEAIAPNISGITSLAIDTQNDLLYWTRQTGENRSTIQRAGLNGRGVVTLQTSLTLMNSIALNATGTTFYWTDILGKIKSKPTQGNTVTLLRQNLSAPRGLVWANDYLYWGEATGHIRRMNLRNTSRQVETITTSTGEPISLAVHNGRVYWTETSGNASKLKRVNTDGTGLTELKTLTGTRRVWLAVDGSDAKIYLTRLSKIERRNLAGQNTVNIVASIESPGSLVLGGDLVRTTPVVSQPTQPRQPTNNAAISKYDINEDGAVNNADTRLVAADVGNSGNAIKTARADVDGSGTVDVTDLILVIANLDDTVAAPAIDIDVKSLDINFDLVQEQIETLLASGDRSIAAQRALLYLQHLLANARPDETVLLANYPNPFNPETWIPYHLAESTDVKIRIYNAQGIVVRELTLGHQSAGYYTSRSRAAYWDGRNALGERVASGIYFYQLETDEMSPLRKMVILK